MNIRAALATTLALSTFFGAHDLFAQTATQRHDEPSAAARAGASPRHLPPTIADLVLLLKSYQPDLQHVQNLRLEITKPLPPTDDAPALAAALHTKAIAADELQDAEARGAFLAQALSYAGKASGVDPADLGGILRLRIESAANAGDVQSITVETDLLVELANEIERSKHNKGLLIGVYDHLVKCYIQIGDLKSAQNTFAKFEAVFRLISAKPGRSLQVPIWTQQLESTRGTLHQSEGHLDDAERSFMAAIRQGEQAVGTLARRAAKGGWTPPEQRLLKQIDANRISLAQTYVNQERLNEAELLLREVLKVALARDGRNSLIVGKTLASLSAVFLNRGRFAEAIVLREWSDATYAEAGFSLKSPQRVNNRIAWANALVADGRAADAIVLIDAIRGSFGDDSRLEEGFGNGTLSSIRAYILTGRLQDALRDADSLLKRNLRYFGVDHYATAEARGYRAMVLRRLARTDEARSEFARAVAVLLEAGKTVSKQQTSVARTNRLRLILNEYILLLVGRDKASAAADQAEAFRIADVARWQSVQKAVTGSALRAAAGSPELAQVIKRVQDADDELQAVYKNLIGQRSSPPEKQLPTVIATMENRIATLKKEQQTDLVEIRRKFPQYDALVNPMPTDLRGAGKVLKRNEALLSIYVSGAGVYVWAVGPDGHTRFHAANRGADWIAAQVKRLRASVDLDAGIAPQRMRFDLDAGYALYQALLAPVEGAWAKADTLLVVANGALGQLPFSMLPTAPAVLTESGGLALSEYRSVPWLARKVAIAYLPSVSAFVTLRALPPGAAGRTPFIGYGDPDFGPDSTSKPEDGAPAPGGTRNLRITHSAKWSAEPSEIDAGNAREISTRDARMLMPLPDTRDEIGAIARVLAADAAADTFFGRQASRENVMHADLRRLKVLAFATHGLIAGDLPDLDQPALALSPPTGQDISAGLLKLEDILKLSLDADLVVLSACNTAAADGSGAEAVSGLGRGFFYAGARAVLATHWPVETVSARELVTHLFERYAADGNLTRAQALRLAMLDVMDRGVAKDERGVAANAYAHPAFWAAYALYGDPGR